MFDLFVAVPDKVIFAGKARMVIAPGSMGSFEVLMNHAPMVSLLAEGKLVIMDGDKKRWGWKLTGGFFQVNNNQVTVLANFLEPCEV